jgi:hypothetical protein
LALVVLQYREVEVVEAGLEHRQVLLVESHSMVAMEVQDQQELQQQQLDQPLEVEEVDQRLVTLGLVVLDAV